MKLYRILIFICLFFCSLISAQTVPFWINVHDVSGTIILAEDDSTLLFDSDLGSHFLLSDYDNFTVGDRVHIVGFTHYELYQEIHFGETYYFFDIEGISTTHCRDINLCCLGLRGNIDFSPDEIINISDIVFLVNYMFGIPNGEAPGCTDEADLNNSGVIEIGDLVDLVDYAFSQNGTELLPCPDIPSTITFDFPSELDSSITLHFLEDGTIIGTTYYFGQIIITGFYNSNSFYIEIITPNISDWGIIMSGTICNNNIAVYETRITIGGYIPQEHHIYAIQ